jgi:hypothetical protein
MTLIVTACTLNFVAQASDRRLAYPNGELFDDDANKCILLECRDASLSLSYTGLGFVRKERTDIWLVDVLVELKAALMPAEAAVSELANVLTREFAQLRPAHPDPRLTLVACGLPRGGGQRSPLLVTISNFEEPDDVSPSSTLHTWRTRPLSNARPQFTCTVGELDPRDKKAVVIQVSGTEEAVQHFPKRARKLREFFSRNPSGEEVTHRLVAFIRRCADHKEEGKFIGRNCMATFMSDARKLYAYYPEDESRPVSFTPHVITPWVAMTSGIRSDRRITKQEMERWIREGKKGAPPDL